MSSEVKSFKDLIAWKKAFHLSIEIYRETANFPLEEKFGLTSELRKTSRSVPYNIAEGHQRFTTREYVRFLDIALGSIAELETQLMIAQRLSLFGDDTSSQLLSLTNEVGRLVRRLAQRLRRQ